MQTLSFILFAAFPGQDYASNPNPGMLNFTAGNLVQCMIVPIFNDNLNEELETFEVTIGSSSQQVLISSASATVIILDDDLCKYRLYLFDLMHLNSSPCSDIYV